MDNKVRVATVYIENDNITLDCICPLIEVSEGDTVQIFLNNDSAVGKVLEMREVRIADLPCGVSNMKTVIRKLSDNTQIRNTILDRISIVDYGNRSRTVTLVGRGVVGQFDFPNIEIDAHNAAPGDLMYFSDYQDTKYVSTILRIEDSPNTLKPRVYIDAIVKDASRIEFLQNRISISEKSGEQQVELRGFTLPCEAFIIQDMVSHICSRAFEHTKKLKKLTVNTDGAIIEPMAFSYNTSLEEIIILDERVTIAINCFDGCKNLRHVVLPYQQYYLKKDLENYYAGRIRFDFDLGRNIMQDGIVYSPDRDVLICCTDKNLEEYNPSSLHIKRIHPYAFKDCKKLKRFIAPPFMDVPSEGCFSGCMALQEVQAYFENDYESILMFGSEPCPNAAVRTLKYIDGSSRDFYMPKEFRIIRMPSPKELLSAIDPKKLSEQVSYHAGLFYLSIRDYRNAIQCFGVAARQGNEKAYQKLAELAYRKGFEEYFSADLYDYARRFLRVKPFFHMFAIEHPEYDFSSLSEEDILAHFSNRDELIALLQKISYGDIFDTDLLNIALNLLFNYTREIHDLEIKRLFLRCEQKIGLMDNVIFWKEELLEEIFALGEEADIREFGFQILPLTDFVDREGKERFINRIDDSETKNALARAHYASMHPQDVNITIFEEFLSKACQTRDVFYQKCAIISVFSYLCHCWRDKKKNAQFKKLLELIHTRYLEGNDYLAVVLLSFKQNMKRSIPKVFYWNCAEKMYAKGLLSSNTFDSLIGMRKQEQAAFFCRFPEFFDLNDKKNFLMTELNNTHFYVPGTVLQKVPRSESEPIMYVHYIPDLTAGELMLFLNPHEAITYYAKNNLPLPEDFYRITIGQVMSLMKLYDITEATVFPRFLNKKITDTLIEASYDWK